MNLFKFAAAILLSAGTFMGTACAQTPEGGVATVRVPQCLQFRNIPSYVPCTGVVPVDSVTGNAISWEDLFSSIQAGNGSSGGPTSTTTIGGAVLTKGTMIVGSDGTLARAVSTDTAGRINTVIYSLPAITGSVNLTGTLPAFAATPTFNLGTGGVGTLMQPLVIACTDATNQRIGCASTSNGGTSGDASSANQTSVQAIAGADASKALSVQGISGGKPFAVTGAFYQTTQPVSLASVPLASGAATAAKQDALLTAVGSPYQAGGSIPLPTGASTASNQTTGNTSLATIATNTAGIATAAKQDSLLAALGTPYQAGGAIPLPTGAATAAKQDVLLAALGTPAQAGVPVSNVVQATSTDIGQIVGTTAVQFMPANSSRKGFSIQVQSTTASCYINGQTTATADYHSLLIGPGGYFEPDHHVGTGAYSIICTAAATSVFGRSW